MSCRASRAIAQERAQVGAPKILHCNPWRPASARPPIDSPGAAAAGRRVFSNMYLDDYVHTHCPWVAVPLISNWRLEFPRLKCESTALVLFKLSVSRRPMTT